MRYETKFQISRAGFAVGFAAAMVCLYELRKNGLDHLHAAVVWFCCLIGVVILTLPLGIMFYYYRARRYDTNESERIAMDTLSKYAETQQSDQSSRDQTPKPQ